MIKINIVTVGNLKEKFWKDAQEEYRKRLTKYCDVKIIEVKEHNEASSIEEIKRREEKEILSKLGGYNILMAIEGENITSEQFANRIENISLTNSNITFVIGGSYGVSDNVKNSCQLLLSFSKQTFPHNLARIMLLEQIYRAFCINAGSGYHK